MASETPLLLSYITILAIVAVFSYSVALTVPGAPQPVGWSGLVGVPNTLSTLTASLSLGQHECGGWEVGCWISNGVNAFVGLATGGWAIVVWLITTLITVGVALFGVATLTFDPPLPLMLQVFLWIVSVPFWLLVTFTVLSFVRGN